MEELDRQMQRRVWQRVQGMPALEESDLRQILLLAMENAGAYLALSRKSAGHQAQTLHRLHIGALSCAHCLMGLAQDMKKPSLPRREADLSGCCRREQALVRSLENRAADPEFGPIFRHLARQATTRWAQGLEILGER